MHIDKPEPGDYSRISNSHWHMHMMLEEKISAARRAAVNTIEAVEQIHAVLSGRHDVGLGLALPSVVAALADYAWRGIKPTEGLSVLDLRHEISAAVELFRGHLIHPSGEPLLVETDRDAIGQVAAAAEAREDIDEGNPVRIDALAALAGVAERTIRAATNPNHPRAIPITKEGHWTWIEAQHAFEWLTRRSDFQPTRAEIPPQMASTVNNRDALATECRAGRARRNAGIEQLAAALDWSDEQLTGYRAIEASQPSAAGLSLSPSVWYAFATHLEMPEPGKFAAQAYRVVVAACADDRIRAELHDTY